MSEAPQTAAFSEDGFSRVAAMKILFLAAIFLFVMVPLAATVLGGFKSLG